MTRFVQVSLLCTTFKWLLHQVHYVFLSQKINIMDTAAVKRFVDDVDLGRKCVLGKELEDELVEYCIKMESTYFGLRRRDIRRFALHLILNLNYHNLKLNSAWPLLTLNEIYRLAFQLAMTNGISHPFSLKSMSAGKKWLKAFPRRHPQLSFRRPQRISVARAKAFTEENIAQFLVYWNQNFKKLAIKNLVFSIVMKLA